MNLANCLRRFPLGYGASYQSPAQPFPRTPSTASMKLPKVVLREAPPVGEKHEVDDEQDRDRALNLARLCRAAERGMP